MDTLLEKYPDLKGFYWAKDKGLYRQKTREEAAKLLENIIFNLKSADDAELIRWGNTLKHWREPILNYFNNHTTNGFTEGCHTKIKMLKRISYGLRKRSTGERCFWGLYHTIWQRAAIGLTVSRWLSL